MAPMPNIGNVVFVPKDRVEKLDISMAEAIDKISMWGIGTREWGKNSSSKEGA